MNAEALILFSTELADEIAVRRKRAGHLLSKGRFLAAQILALLEDELWLDNARAANAAAQTLAKAAPQRLVHPVEANEVFVSFGGGSGRTSRPRLRFLRLGTGRNPVRHQLGLPGEGSNGSRRRSPRCDAA